MTSSSSSRMIKSTIARLGPQASPQKIVETLAGFDIDVSETHVRHIKAQMLRAEAQAARHRSQKPIKDRRKKRPQQRKIPARRA